MKRSAFVLSNLRKLNFEKERLVFTHIPKCGGTSLHDMFKKHMGPKYILRDSILKKESIDLKNASGIGGHMAFGNPIAHDDHKRSINVTILRDPYERLMSYHGHLRLNPTHSWAKRHPKCLEMNFTEFVCYMHAANDPQMSNHQTAMLTQGVRFPTTFEAAQTVLENCFTVVGVLNNYDNFIRMTSALIGAKVVKTPHSRKGQKKPSVKGRDELAARELVYSLNKEDLKLWQYHSRLQKDVVDHLEGLRRISKK